VRCALCHEIIENYIEDAVLNLSRLLFDATTFKESEKKKEGKESLPWSFQHKKKTTQTRSVFLTK
jgi:hypothetical protein